MFVWLHITLEFFKFLPFFMMEENFTTSILDDPEMISNINVEITTSLLMDEISEFILTLGIF